MNSELFNSDWRFCDGPLSGAEALDFDDSNWRRVALPFDFLIGKSFDSRHSAGHGYLPGGTGWYRRHFRIDLPEATRRFIDFEGVSRLSRVWCNGTLLGFRPNGSLGCEYELTGHLRPGDNVIAVCAEVPSPCCRWYPGGGICRDVRMLVTGSRRFLRHGIHVETSELSDRLAGVAVTAETDSERGSIALELISPAGTIIASASRHVDADGGAKFAFDIPSPRRWDVDSPQLYTLNAQLIEPDGEISDRRTLRFGVREIKFTRDDGFHLNGRRVQIRGVCLHENFGCLGGANFPDALRRQLEILRRMGCNAIRTAHNPPSPRLLDLCDETGMLVMDEAFDEWRVTKGAAGFRQCVDATDIEATIRRWNIPEDYHGYSHYFDEWAERDLSEFVRRDRHHPSVVLWSIGNEILEQATPAGAETARFLTAIIHRLDPSRPVTAGVSDTPGALSGGMGAALDVFGINYTPQHYRLAHAHHRVIGSETVASEYSRGEYLFDTSRRDWRFAEALSPRRLDWDGNEIEAPDASISVPPRPGCSCHRDTAFMTNVAGTPVELALATQEAMDFSAGEFVWSGFDYLGEPFCAVDGIRWPQRSSNSGLVDTAGFPKDVYHLYRSCWSSEPMAYLMPHWSWPDAAGSRLPVRCFTNGDEAELFLNGRSLGVRHFADTRRRFLEWFVEYEPGTLRVVAKRNGKFHAEYTLKTAGDPEKIELLCPADSFGGPDNELAFVTIRSVDGAGTVTPDANFPVLLTLSGPGELLGVDNGDSLGHDAFTGNMIHLYHGLALAVLRALPGQTGRLMLTATTPEGMGSVLELQVTP